MKMGTFHISVQGASHLRKNKECQDASDSYRDERCAIAVVCDGHGGNDYIRSALGAKFACQSAMQDLKSFLEHTDAEQMRTKGEVLIRTLEASIISHWHSQVEAYTRCSPFTAEELGQVSEKARQKYQSGRVESAYGTTLIAAAVTADYWFGIQIGDGKCVAVNPEGKFRQPIPRNEKCFLNATTSICDENALENFRHFYSRRLPVALFVGSDGVDDCFKSDEQLQSLYRTVLYSFTQSAFDAAVTEFSDYLPRLSAKGSGDDVSVAAILDLGKIGEIESVKAFDKAKERAKVEEHARQEEARLEEERKRVQARFDEQERARQARQEAALRAREAAERDAALKAAEIARQEAARANQEAERAHREAERARQEAARARQEAERVIQEADRKAREEAAFSSWQGIAPQPWQADGLEDASLEPVEFCPECGSMLYPGESCCTYCGAWLAAAPSERTLDAEPIRPGISSDVIAEAQAELTGLVTQMQQEEESAAAEAAVEEAARQALSEERKLPDEGRGSEEEKTERSAAPELPKPAAGLAEELAKVTEPITLSLDLF